MGEISIAVSEAEIRRCYAVMRQLRTELSESDFLGRVKLQQQVGYSLAYLTAGGEVRTVAGYRISHNLAWGKFLYVDDLVTDSNSRSHSFGASMFDWLVREAKSAACDQLHLDSGVQRFEAHRFYLLHRMNISSHHFSLKL